MSQETIKELKTQICHYQAAGPFFQAPIDLAILHQRLEAAEDQERGGDGGFVQNYQDFLWPLPEHLQPTERGMPDPNQIQIRRESQGMNKKQEYSAKKDLRQELKIKNSFKNRPGAPAPKAKEEIRYTRKMKIAPRPGGGTASIEGE